MAAPDRWQAYLLTDERLLWEGAPEPDFRLRGREIFQIVSGLPILAIGVICLLLGIEALLSPTDPPLLFAIFATAFGGVGGYMVFQPIFGAYTTARHIRYALSTRAAFVVRDWPIRRLEVYPILPSSEITLKRGGKVDTVSFHVRCETGSEGDVAEERIGFQHITNGAHVFRMIQSLQTGKLD
jgi:hypothetical protein